jgi:hypothetical protein
VEGYGMTIAKMHCAKNSSSRGLKGKCSKTRLLVMLVFMHTVFFIPLMKPRIGNLLFFAKRLLALP